MRDIKVEMNLLREKGSSLFLTPYGRMSRPFRIEFPDAWYHVMNRGINLSQTLNPVPNLSFVSAYLEFHDNLTKNSVA